MGEYRRSRNSGEGKLFSKSFPPPHKTHLATAGAVEDEEEQDDNDDPEELFVVKNVAQASHSSIPFCFHLDFSPINIGPSGFGHPASGLPAALIPLYAEAEDW